MWHMSLPFVGVNIAHQLQAVMICVTDARHGLSVNMGFDTWQPYDVCSLNQLHAWMSCLLAVRLAFGSQYLQTHCNMHSHALTFAIATFCCSSAAVVVTGSLFSGMSITVVIPPAAAADVPVVRPASHHVPRTISKLQWDVVTTTKDGKEWP